MKTWYVTFRAAYCVKQYVASMGEIKAEVTSCRGLLVTGVEKMNYNTALEACTKSFYAEGIELYEGTKADILPLAWSINDID